MTESGSPFFRAVVLRRRKQVERRYRVFPQTA